MAAQLERSAEPNSIQTSGETFSQAIKQDIMLRTRSSRELDHSTYLPKDGVLILSGCNTKILLLQNPKHMEPVQEGTPTHLAKLQG